MSGRSIISRRIRPMHFAHTKYPFLVKRTAESGPLVKQKLHRTVSFGALTLRSDSRSGAASRRAAARLVHEWQIPPSAPAVPVSFSIAAEQKRHFTIKEAICRLTCRAHQRARPRRALRVSVE